MNKGIHICIFCGQLKRGAQGKCAACGRIPELDEDKAKSLILSTSYFLPGTDYLGKSDEELRRISSDIIAGRPYEFHHAEVQRIVNFAKDVAAITPSRLAIDFVRWLAAPFALLMVIYFALYSK